jgi:hypothetical protein
MTGCQALTKTGSTLQSVVGSAYWSASGSACSCHTQFLTTWVALQHGLVCFLAGIYFVPPEGNYQSYLNQINALPVFPQPEVGQEGATYDQEGYARADVLAGAALRIQQAVAHSVGHNRHSG